MNTNATPPAFSAPRSIDLVETAKLVRKHLAATFPGQKFTVRTSRFSMGSSIDVGWVDGRHPGLPRRQPGDRRGLLLPRR
jgi:hypothetical protein